MKSSVHPNVGGLEHSNFQRDAARLPWLAMALIIFSYIFIFPNYFVNEEEPRDLLVAREVAVDHATPSQIYDRRVWGYGVLGPYLFSVFYRIAPEILMFRAVGLAAAALTAALLAFFLARRFKVPWERAILGSAFAVSLHQAVTHTHVHALAFMFEAGLVLALTGPAPNSAVRWAVAFVCAWVVALMRPLPSGFYVLGMLAVAAALEWKAAAVRRRVALGFFISLLAVYQALSMRLSPLHLEQGTVAPFRLILEMFSFGTGAALLSRMANDASLVLCVVVAAAFIYRFRRNLTVSAAQALPASAMALYMVVFLAKSHFQYAHDTQWFFLCGFILLEKRFFSVSRNLLPAVAACLLIVGLQVAGRSDRFILLWNKATGRPFMGRDYARDLTPYGLQGFRGVRGFSGDVWLLRSLVEFSDRQDASPVLHPSNYHSAFIFASRKPYWNWCVDAVDWTYPDRSGYLAMDELPYRRARNLELLEKENPLYMYDNQNYAELAKKFPQRQNDPLFGRLLKKYRVYRELKPPQPVFNQFERYFIYKRRG